VRELRNVVERAVYRWDDPTLPVSNIVFDPFQSPWRPEPARAHVEAADASAQAPPAPPASDFRGAVAAYEASLLQDALARHRHNQRATAKALGLSYDQLRHALRKHGLLDQAD
jgi:psp operon transcriptional activator